MPRGSGAQVLLVLGLLLAALSYLRLRGSAHKGLVRRLFCMSFRSCSRLATLLFAVQVGAVSDRSQALAERLLASFASLSRRFRSPDRTEA